jgi:hypothetical protein
MTTNIKPVFRNRPTVNRHSNSVRIAGKVFFVSAEEDGKEVIVREVFRSNQNAASKGIMIIILTRKGLMIVERKISSIVIRFALITMLINTFIISLESA